jgi:DMSO/TMAO reductase YedYZ heme-binding membrane subunit
MDLPSPLVIPPLQPLPESATRVELITLRRSLGILQSAIESAMAHVGSYRRKKLRRRAWEIQQQIIEVRRRLAAEATP